MQRAIAMVLCVCWLVGCTTSPQADSKEKLTSTVMLYYANMDETKLVAEAREVPKAEQEKFMRDVMLELIKPPTKPELKRVFAPNVALLNMDVEEGTVTIDLSDGFDAQNILTRYAIIKTITALPNVAKIRILKNHKPIRGRNGVIVQAMGKEDLVDSAPPIPTDQALVTLYFAQLLNQQWVLKSEKRIIAVKSEEPREKSILLELIKGPKEREFTKTMPSGTKLISVETKEGTCFVNLSQDFVGKQNGNVQEKEMAIYAVVNALTEQVDVKRVQFLIEGQKMSNYKGDLVFNEPFERNTKFIHK
ncbi:MAG: GerMN domain-containing protein [Hyphomonadaceae bacterium]|nr:GerMN domain-containing protein [Clostridia bacterium]